MTKFVLASSSPARKKVLEGAGFDFAIRVADVDEDAILEAALSAHGDLPIGTRVALLAEAKARAVADIMAEDIGVEVLDAAGAIARGVQGKPADSVLILGCDSMLQSSLGITGKPKTAERAFEIMTSTAGHDVTLMTGHHLIELTAQGRSQQTRIVATTVHMAQMSDDEKHHYIDTGEPLEVAGAFTIDGFGGPFIRAITGDHHNVLGLSLPVLREMLGEFGYTVNQFWVND